MGAAVLMVYSAIRGVNPWDELSSIITGKSRPTPTRFSAGNFDNSGAAPTVSGLPSGARGSIVAFATAQIGKPYKWAATGPNSYDCSGLVKAAYATANKILPHNSAAMSVLGKAISAGQARSGDLVFYGHPAHHVAIYIGNGRVIAAPDFGLKVQEQSVDMGPSMGIPYYRNLLGDTGAVAGGVPGSTAGGGSGGSW